MNYLKSEDRFMTEEQFARLHHREWLGPGLLMEDSIPDGRDNNCPYCGKKGTPKYIAYDYDAGVWFCGSALCREVYILAHMGASNPP